MQTFCNTRSDFQMEKTEVCRLNEIFEWFFMFKVYQIHKHEFKQKRTC